MFLTLLLQLTGGAEDKHENRSQHVICQLIFEPTSS
jgi:hypothetical protein